MIYVTFKNITVISSWSVLLVEKPKFMEKTTNLFLVTDKINLIRLYKAQVDLATDWVLTVLVHENYMLLYCEISFLLVGIPKTIELVFSVFPQSSQH